MLIIAVLHPLVGAIYEIIDWIGLVMFISLLIIVGYSMVFGKDRHILEETPIKAVGVVVAVLLIGPFVLPELSKEISLILLKIAFGMIVIVATLTLCSFIPSFTKKEGERHSKPRPA